MKTTILKTMPTTNPKVRTPMNHGSSPRALVLVTLFVAFFAFLPGAQAVCQEGCDSTNFNAFLGDDALISNTIGAGNTAIGWRSLFSNIDGSFNTGLGGGTLVLNNGSSNTAVGAAALLLNTTGVENTAVGTDAMVFNDSGLQNTAIGAFALFNNTAGGADTAIGWSALTNDNGIGSNTAVGASALSLNTSGFENCALGTDALVFNDSGSFNNAVGAFALDQNVNGDGNNAFGDSALFSNVSSFGNTAVGDSALFGSTGSVNTALGVGAGLNQTTGSNNIYICDSGVAGESNVIAIGASPSTLLDYTDTFIGGIFGNPTAGSAVYISASGQLSTTPSSRRFKDDIKPMGNTSETIFSLKPVTFHYKDEKRNPLQQWGLIAEEVEEVNPALVLPDKEGKPATVRYEQINAMLLNEFLKEHKKVEQQQANIAELKSTVAQQQKGMEVLTAQLKEQAAQIQRVRDQVQMNSPDARAVVSED
jgi:hypothetical protein